MSQDKPKPAGPAPRPAALASAWGDLGDGTYANPVLPGDFSDTDAIRVGDDFYAITSTFHYSPGVAILHSKDLVNWQIVGHAVPDITQIGPEMNYDKMDRYGRGVWAGAIRYHDGKFFVYFGTPDEGFFMTTAKDVRGPWEPLHPVLKSKGWDDCCPFWDDDGKAYFVATHFADGYKITLFDMTPDGRTLDETSQRLLYSSKGSEASKLYKIDGTYYHYFSEVHGGRRDAMMRRAKSLNGPWEMRQLNRVEKAVDREPNQGGLIDVPGGGWWFLTHQGSAAWEGRTLALLPVTWVDGWPVPGKVEADGIGTMVWQSKKPKDTGPAARPTTDDDFAAPDIAQQWEWNYQPRPEKWSLTERPGFLRLNSFKPLHGRDLAGVGNMLTQRAYRTATNEVTVKLDVSGMKDGDEAGLSHFARSFAWAGVTQSGTARRVQFSDGKRTVAGPDFSGTNLWLRSTWDLDGLSQFAYSLDGQAFTPIGAPYPLVWKSYRGDRVGLLNYNLGGDGGHVDVDSFAYRFAGPGLK